MIRILIVFLLIMLTGCGGETYVFERIETGETSELPLKFDSVRGVRDGESVEAEIRFVNGSDSAHIFIKLRLGPPAEFVSGAHRTSVNGRQTEGRVACPSLTYLGGQNDVPSVGGTFVLHDADNRPVYRARLSPTPVTRRAAF